MSKVQFNLLPDLKLKNVKASTTRIKITQICFAVASASVILFIFTLFWTYTVQKRQLSGTEKDVAAAITNLQKTPDLDKILTVQKQLDTLSSLHQSKHITSRLFGYLPAITPSTVQYNQLSMDIDTTTMQMSGTATNIQSINAFVDTLKIATFKIGSGASKAAFSDVVENSFSISSGNVSYSVSFKFDTALFTGALDDQGKPLTPIITVPTQVTNRSNDPSSVLFGGTN